MKSDAKTLACQVVEKMWRVGGEGKNVITDLSPKRRMVHVALYEHND